MRKRMFEGNLIMRQQTSSEAWRRLAESGNLGNLRQMAYDYIKVHPKCTQLDISRDCGESVRKRINELETIGVIEKAGQVKIGKYYYNTYVIKLSMSKLKELNLELQTELSFT